MNLKQIGLTAAVLVSLAATVGPAQGGEPKVNVQHFKASPHAGDLMMIRTATWLGGGFSGGFLFSYARDPLVIEDHRSGRDDVFHPVEQHLVADLFASYSAWRRFSAGINLPVVLFAAGSSGIQAAPTADAWGLGDMRLALRFLILPRNGDGFGMGIDADIGFPTATKGTYAGSGGFSGTPRVVLDYQFPTATLIALNLGARLMETRSIVGFDRGGGLAMGLGLRQGFMDDRFQLLGEMTVFSSWTGGLSQNGTALEGQVGINACVGDWARVYVAGGGGIVGGMSEAAFRVTSGFRFERCTYTPPAPKPEPPKPEPPKPEPPKPEPPKPPEPETPKPEPPKPPEPETPKELLEIALRIQFETSRAVLLPASKKELDTVAEWIQTHPVAGTIRVEGHTDNVGSAESNLTLSTERAQAVVTYLTKKGVPANRLEAKGFGDQRPIGDNTTADGRKANRRVEFKVSEMEGGHE